MRSFVSLAVVLFALVSFSYGQTTTKTKATSIPPGWSKLKLSDVQKKSIADVKAKFKPTIDQAEKVMANARAQEATALYQILTKEQQMQLQAQLGIVEAVDTKLQSPIEAPAKK